MRVDNGPLFSTLQLRFHGVGVVFCLFTLLISLNISSSSPKIVIFQIVTFSALVASSTILWLGIEDMYCRPILPENSKNSQNIVLSRCERLFDNTTQQLRLYARIGVFEHKLYGCYGSSITRETASRFRQDEQS
jgi:hypothetical protein